MGFKVVVTGGSSGIGRACAARFAGDGHDVIITGRSESKLAETVSLAKEAGSAGVVFKGVGDVGVKADVVRNHEEAIKALGHIDVIVLNAGLCWAQTLEEYSAEDFDTIFNTNVRGVFLWLKAVLPALKCWLLAEPSLYGASKFALRGMAEGLRLEVRGTGIKVASVFPGAVDTDIWKHENWGREKIDPRQQYGLDSAMLPEDLANAIASIVYQDPRSDIDLLRVLPNFGPLKSANH